jgi:hypothetical protein
MWNDGYCFVIGIMCNILERGKCIIWGVDFAVWLRYHIDRGRLFEACLESESIIDD